jgi:hypothetical protein
MESVILQELELSRSQLKDWEDLVPLPKFISYPRETRSRSRGDANDVFYHYHFLAQIAHRIILTRIRAELYCNNPSTSMADELRHQLEQWAVNQPDLIKVATETSLAAKYDSPAHIVASSLLKMRYRVGIFHIGRPFLYKAIQQPFLITQADLKICADALSYAMDWPLALDPCVGLPSFMPLKFFIAGQMFGQLLIFHAIQKSQDARIRSLLPEGYQTWCSRMLGYMSTAKALSPTIEKDFRLVSALYGYAMPTTTSDL